MSVASVVAGLGSALPPSVTQQEMWEGYFARHYSGNARGVAERIFAHSGATRRQAAVNPVLEDVSDWSTERRMRRYLAEALPLGKEAVGRALTGAGLDAAELGLFAVCSCTGYATPGLDILLARDLGMAPGTQRMFVGHMGCYAALPALRTAAALAAASGQRALVASVELCSLHLQPARSRQEVVSQSLFGDGAAAALVGPGGDGPEIIGTRTRTVAGSEMRMGWLVADDGFHMELSPRVPALVERGLLRGLQDLGAGGNGKPGCIGVGWGWGSIIFVAQDQSIGELVYLYVGYCHDGDAEAFYFSEQAVELCPAPG